MRKLTKYQGTRTLTKRLRTPWVNGEWHEGHLEVLGMEAADEIDRLQAEIDSLKRMAEIDKAFHDVTLAERNLAWYQLEHR